MKLYFFVISLFFLSMNVFAGPPEPEIGERWIINVEYSDEFNGNSLDRNKWNDQFKNWQGRKPARFEKNTISVSNGNMQIRNGVSVDGVAHNKNRFTIAGGAVQSAKETAHFGYYECKFRASRINMSTTFWLASSGHPLLATSKTNDTFSQELDICESIGGAGNFSSDFRKKMKFNTHYRVRDCGGCKETFYSRGNNQVEIRDGELQGGDADLRTSESWEDFHTYGCDWRNPQEAWFYVDNRFIRSVRFRTDIVPDPFAKPMRVNMVTETYNWATPYPTNQQLRNNSINTSYYDWMRSYQRIGIEEKNPFSKTVTIPSSPTTNRVTNGDFEQGNFNGWIGFGTTELVTTNTYNNSGYAVKVNGPNSGREYVVTLKPNTDYTLTAQIKSTIGSVAFGIKDVGGPQIKATTLNNRNYAKAALKFNSGTVTNAKFFLFVSKNGDEAFGDNFELKEDGVVGPSEPNQNVTGTYAPIFSEEIRFFEAPKFKNGNTKVEIPYIYKANVDREFRLHIIDESNKEVFETGFIVLEGYGKNVKTIDLPSALSGNESNYTFLGEIREIGKGVNTIVDSTGDASILSVFSVAKNTLKTSLYPNPTKSNVNLSIPGAQGMVSVEVYDPLGKLLINTNFDSSEISLETAYLAQGIYFVRIKNGNKVANKKLIIQ